MRRLPETHATDPVSKGTGVAIETHTIDLEREASYKTKSQAGQKDIHTLVANMYDALTNSSTEELFYDVATEREEIQGLKAPEGHG